MSMPAAAQKIPATRAEAAAQLLPIARRIGRHLARVHGRGEDPSEIDGAAHLGLADALSRFDPSRAEIFCSYAVQRIRGAVFDELRRRDPRSRYAREARDRVRDTQRTMELSSGRAATEEQVAAELGTTVQRMRDQVVAGATIKLVPLPDSEEAMSGISETPVGAQAPRDPFASCARGEVLARIAEALEHLVPRDRQVLESYFFQELTLAEIAKTLGVTEARVSQLLSRAVAKVREVVGADL